MLSVSLENEVARDPVVRAGVLEPVGVRVGERHDRSRLVGARSVVLREGLRAK